LFDEQHTGTQFLTYLHIFNTRDTVRYRDGTFIISENLYKQIKWLIEYLDNQMASDYGICQSEIFVKGIRDVFLKPEIYFSHKTRQVIEYIQKIFWHWFELKTQITVQNRRHSRKKYILKTYH
jgi:hypothetical protein